MEGLVKLSFYCFASASFSLAAAMLCYIAFTVGRVRLQHAIMTTPEGTTISASRAEFSPAPESFGGFGTMLAWFGVVMAFFAVLTRTIAAGHLPISNMFEFSLTFVFAISAIYVVFERVYKTRHLGAIVMAIAFGMTLYMWMLPADMREVNPLIPALQAKPIMTVHVSSAILAYATFSVSFAAAVLYLIKINRNVSWLPGADMLDEIGFRAVTVGFPLLSLVLILGSVWANDAWGTYWSWDPKETAALFTWLVYAVYLHTRTLRGWRGKRSAYILLFGFAAVIFTYYGNYFFGGLHAYGGV